MYILIHVTFNICIIYERGTRIILIGFVIVGSIPWLKNTSRSSDTFALLFTFTYSKFWSVPNKMSHLVLTSDDITSSYRAIDGLSFVFGILYISAIIRFRLSCFASISAYMHSNSPSILVTRSGLSRLLHLFKIYTATLPFESIFRHLCIKL